MAIIHATDNNFETEVLSSEKPVLVDFWAAWCGPCKMIAPFIDQVASDYEGKAVVAKVDVDKCPELARRYGIASIPTLMVFKNGQAVDTFKGATNKARIAELIDKAL